MHTNNFRSPESSGSKKLTFRRFLTPRAIGVVLLLAATLGAGAAAVSNADQAEVTKVETDVIIQGVETVVLKLANDIRQSRTYTGLVTARRSADLGFERSARLSAILVDDGDVVRSGETIAVLETLRLDSKRRETLARHQAAVAVLNELVAGPRAETIAAARAEVADLQSQLELRKRTYKRTEQLRKQNAATDQDIDDSHLGLKSTEARLNASQKRLEELQAGTRQEQIKAQQANVEQLIAALQDIDIEIDQSVLKAPFTGRIAARLIDEGTVVSPGQPVVRIVEHQTLEARIGLPLEAAQSLAIGDCIELSAGQIRCGGKLVRMLPEIDIATRTQTVVIEVQQASAPGLIPGQVVHASVEQQIDMQGFLLPTPSLLPGIRGLWSVFAVVQKDGKSLIQSRHVEVLHTSGDQVLVRGTLSEGDRIVTSGVQRLVSGQQVKVLD